tara:strand:- start:158 stop:625 length:468 start_codon:yes stop_codon:yes gene_type:complete
MGRRRRKTYQSTSHYNQPGRGEVTNPGVNPYGPYGISQPNVAAPPVDPNNPNVVAGTTHTSHPRPNPWAGGGGTGIFGGMMPKPGGGVISQMSSIFNRPGGNPPPGWGRRKKFEAQQQIAQGGNINNPMFQPPKTVRRRRRGKHGWIPRISADRL